MATKDRRGLLCACEAVGSGTHCTRYERRVGPDRCVIGWRGCRACRPIRTGAGGHGNRGGRGLPLGVLPPRRPSPLHRSSQDAPPPCLLAYIPRRPAMLPRFPSSSLPPLFQGRAFSCAFLSTAVLSFPVLSVPVRPQFINLRQAQSCSSPFLSPSFWPLSSSPSLCSVTQLSPLPQSATRRRSRFR